MKKTILLLFVLSLYTVGLGAQNRKSVSLDQTYRDFRFSAGGGFAFRLGDRVKESDPKLDRLSKDLMRGYNLDMDAQYFFTDLWGLGINANYVQSGASGKNLTIPNFGNANKYKENNKFFFVGATASVRADMRNFLWIATFGFGPLFYTNDMYIDDQLIRGTQTAFAAYGAFSGEYKISRSMGAGIKLSYTNGSIKSLNYGDNKTAHLDEGRWSVSNFMITAFLSFKTWE